MASGLTWFFLGQLSVILLMGALMKLFLFGEAPSHSRPALRAPKHIRTSSLSFMTRSPPQSVRKRPSASSVLRPVPINATDIASILRKTYYQIELKNNGRPDHRTHQPESLDWFNVLLAQTIAQYRQTAYNLKDLSPDQPSMLTSLSKAINEPSKKPSWIDEIKITEISMGEEFPIFSNVRVVTLEDETSPTGHRLQALMDVDISDDNLTLGIETKLLLNYPKPFSAVLPVALTVSVVRFSATLSISFVPAAQDPVKRGETVPQPSSKPKTDLAFAFLPDYRLDLSVRSLLGSRTRLQDIPKVAQLIEARVHSWFEERAVEPRVQVVPLPGLWPRMGKTRVREGQEEDRPVSQDGGRPLPTLRAERKSDHFPSQEEAEARVHGLRHRPGGPKRRNSEAVYDDGDDERRWMPGSLPA